jgi:hypothetical protein
MKISLDLTARGLVNAMRWKRQDLLNLKRPDLGMALTTRRTGAFKLIDVADIEPGRRDRLTKPQRLAKLRAEERLASADQ